MSNRLGCILNTHELTTFVHYPNKSVVCSKLGLQGGKTKLLPQEAINQKYVLGINHHNGTEHEVTLNDQMRLRHTHIIGATGVGKSTLIANMMIEDMKLGNGCVLFDPHGDIVEDILVGVPEHRKDDVILIDPSDTDYPVGFNLLDAKTDAEKIVLSSDLVSSFQRHATAWGDTMTAVLSNAINTFLDSSRDGTLIELKRFLLEEKFRHEFLTSVEDPSIHYYWHNEYAMVRKSIAPLLTRIDTFLRPKILRYMLAQTKGVDFRQCIEGKKIVLIKLSQGLIGDQNSFLLGSIFLSKFNQVAQARQSLSKSQRHPYYIYLDEFQNFITPSITRILSGARKYGLGLILAHQELAQIDDTKTLNSVISNPHIRICFRLGDVDAKRLESGFSYFEQQDLQSLGIGQAIMRIGSSQDDCNISTFPLPQIATHAQILRESIITNTRKSYAQPKSELDQLLVELLPKQPRPKTKLRTENLTPKVEEPVKKVPPGPPPTIEIPKGEEKKPVTKSTDNSEVLQKKKVYLKHLEKQERVKQHQEIQNFIRTIARQRGFKAEIEKQTTSGGRVDVALTHKNINIAIEVAITNSIYYEVQNVQKCLADNYSYIYVISESTVHLKNIQQKLEVELIQTNNNIFFLKPQEFIQHLDSLDIFKTKQERKIKGYRVKTDFSDDRSLNSSVKQNEINDMIIKSMRNKKR